MDLSRGQATWFIPGVHYYITCYGNHQFKESPLHYFCDNRAVITTVNEMLMPSIIQPNNATNNDRDVYLAICDEAKKCNPFQPSFLHVLGNQDKDPKWMLMPIEQLNIACNKWAKQYVQSTSQSSTSLGNPAIPGAQPHINIHRTIIRRKFIQVLRNATSTLAYCQYLHSKLHWSTCNKKLYFSFMCYH